jgi:hypothetical protein
MGLVGDAIFGRRRSVALYQRRCVFCVDLERYAVISERRVLISCAADLGW